jgi:hypothetical protein
MENGMIRACLLALLIALMPAVSLADALPIETYFQLYVLHVDDDTQAIRMQQLFTNLSAGAFKTQAKQTLFEDLDAAIQAKKDAYQTLYMDPLNASQTDVGDTNIDP